MSVVSGTVCELPMQIVFDSVSDRRRPYRQMVTRLYLSFISTQSAGINYPLILRAWRKPRRTSEGIRERSSENSRRNRGFSVLKNSHKYFALLVTSISRNNFHAVFALTKAVVDVRNFTLGNQSATLPKETIVRSRIVTTRPNPEYNQLLYQ